MIGVIIVGKLQYQMCHQHGFTDTACPCNDEITSAAVQEDFVSRVSLHTSAEDVIGYIILFKSNGTVFIHDGLYFAITALQLIEIEDDVMRCGVFVRLYCLHDDCVEQICYLIGIVVWINADTVFLKIRAYILCHSVAAHVREICRKFDSIGVLLYFTGNCTDTAQIIEIAIKSINSCAVERIFIAIAIYYAINEHTLSFCTTIPNHLCSLCN